jgi:phage/plasmid-like protein (TIGR03299 family)
MKSRVTSQFMMQGDIGRVYGGVEVNGALGLQAALKTADLDWEVGLQPIVMDDESKTPIPGHFATYRKDTNFPLGVVKSRYTPVQNQDAFSWLQDVIGKDDACVTSAGALHGGRYTWVCLDLGGFDVLPEDEVRKHMIVLNSHDGSSNLLAQLLPHRIVCQNVLNFALGAGGGSEPFKIRHTDTAMVKLSEVQRVISIAHESFNEVQETFGQFKEIPVTSEQSTNVVYSSLGVTEDDLKEFNTGEYKKQPQWVNHANLINEVIAKGPGCDIPGVGGTLWGTFNGINSYYDHVRTVRGAGDNPDNAIESRLMGHAARMKTKAFVACRDAMEGLRN